jgi:hypothetical protein
MMERHYNERCMHGRGRPKIGYFPRTLTRPFRNYICYLCWTNGDLTDDDRARIVFLDPRFEPSRERGNASIAALTFAVILVTVVGFAASWLSSHTGMASDHAVILVGGFLALVALIVNWGT